MVNEAYIYLVLWSRMQYSSKYILYGISSKDQRRSACARAVLALLPEEVRQDASTAAGKGAAQDGAARRNRGVGVVRR